MLLVFCLWLFFAPNGVVRYYRLRQEIAELKQENEILEQQKSSLAEDIERLKTDPAYLEEVTRDKYGFIRKNEMIFDFSKRRKKH